MFFVNETKYDRELNTIKDVLTFLKNKYLAPKKKGLKSDWDRKIFFEKQEEWMENPDQCFGCGFLGIEDKNVCPECGLHLT